jgi:hypothetical protein
MLIRQMVEGGIGFALTHTFRSEITFKDGAVEQQNFADCPLLYLAQMPKVEAVIVDSVFGNPFYVIVEGMAPVRVGTGGFVLLPHGHQHVLASSPEITPVPFDNLMADQGIRPSFDTPLHFTSRGGGSVSDLYTGIMVRAAGLGGRAPRRRAVRAVAARASGVGNRRERWLCVGAGVH